MYFIFQLQQQFSRTFLRSFGQGEGVKVGVEATQEEEFGPQTAEQTLGKAGIDIEQWRNLEEENQKMILELAANINFINENIEGETLGIKFLSTSVKILERIETNPDYKPEGPEDERAYKELVNHLHSLQGDLSTKKDIVDIAQAKVIELRSQVQDLIKGVEIRDNNTPEAYSKILKDTKYREVLTKSDGDVVTFEEIHEGHLLALKQAGYDLREFFLLNTNGESFSGAFREKSVYTFTTHGNANLDRTSMVLLSTAANKIQVNETSLVLQEEGKHGVGYYTPEGEKYFLTEGDSIAISSLSERRRQDNNLGEKLGTQNASNASDAFVASQVEQALYANPGETVTIDTIDFGTSFLGKVLANIIKFLKKMSGEEDVSYDETTGRLTIGVTNQEFVNNYIAEGTSLGSLGSLSARYESGDNGVNAYNPNDNGNGPSYGTYQMNTDRGVYKEFAAKYSITEGKQGWEDAITAAGSEAAFQEMEHAFIKEKNYDVMMSKIETKGKENFSGVMQNVIWSSAVQHGPSRTEILKAINEFDGEPGNPLDEKNLINTIYDVRGELYAAGKNGRYMQERHEALNMLRIMTVQGNSSQEVDADIPESLPENRKKILSFAHRAIQNEDTLGAAHCTDWVNRLYKHSTGKRVYDSHRSLKGDYKTGQGKGTGIIPNTYASPEAISNIQAGDHLAVDRKDGKGGGFQSGDTHSVIALGTPSGNILKVASWSGKKSIKPRVHYYDLSGKGEGGEGVKAYQIHSPA